MGKNTKGRVGLFALVAPGTKRSVKRVARKMGVGQWSVIEQGVALLEKSLPKKSAGK